MTIDHDNDPDKEVGSAQQTLRGAIDILVAAALSPQHREWVDTEDLAKQREALDAVLTFLAKRRAA